MSNKDFEFKKYYLKFADDGSGLWYETAPEERSDNSPHIHTIDVAIIEHYRLQLKTLKEQLAVYKQDWVRSQQQIVLLSFEAKKLRNKAEDYEEALEQYSTPFDTIITIPGRPKFIDFDKGTLAKKVIEKYEGESK